MLATRRQFIACATRLAALAAGVAAMPGNALTRAAAYPFRLGVASGSPRPDSVVLWTRLSSDPLSREPFALIPVGVRWEIAEDDGFRRIIAAGTAPAMPELAHSVHVDATGLQADRWYWYRFHAGGATSPVGRTRTAPSPHAMPAQLRLAVASCQHWEFGAYGAHRHIAASAPDLVAFLGDYIYEWGPYDPTHPPAARAREIESFTLSDYRLRYAQYKADPLLQAAHLAAPWIVTWDDHEVANDYGNDRDERRAPDFIARRAAAYQAFYEHMPIRLPVLPAGAYRFAFMRLYERYDWGQLARFHVLDDRQYRSYHACQPAGRGGSSSVTAACQERVQPARTMLGMQQEAWLAHGLTSSPARWNILAQQTLMAQASQVPVHGPDDGRFWTDGWDGYPAARTRLLGALAGQRAANPLVLSGDVHTFYAADLQRDFARPASASNPVLATEFCGTSVTSSSRPQSRTDRYVADNPHIRYGRSDRRGYMMLEISANRAVAHFEALDDVHNPNSAITRLASFAVEDGRPGVQRIDTQGNRGA